MKEDSEQNYCQISDIFFMPIRHTVLKMVVTILGSIYKKVPIQYKCNGHKWTVSQSYI